LYNVSGELDMQQIAVSKLRANMMKILKKIEHGASIDITSRGRIIAKLVPPDYSKNLARKKLTEIGKSSKIGDVIAPIETEWKVIEK
jgi:prevent-host-death family protein